MVLEIGVDGDLLLGFLLEHLALKTEVGFAKRLTILIAGGTFGLRLFDLSPQLTRLLAVERQRVQGEADVDYLRAVVELDLLPDWRGSATECLYLFADYVCALGTFHWRFHRLFYHLIFEERLMLLLDHFESSPTHILSL